MMYDNPMIKTCTRCRQSQFIKVVVFFYISALQKLQLQMPIYFKLSCHTIDRGFFELSYIYHTIDKTSSFTVVPSLTWLLVYSWCTIRLSGLRIPIFSNERANSSRQFTLHFLVVQSTRVVLNGDFYIKRQKRLQALR